MLKRWLSPILVLLFFVISHPLFATHNRAGEITFRNLGYLQYEVTVTTYTKFSSTQADRPTIELNWGDGSIEVVNRVNGPILGGSSIPDGENLGNDIKLNIYRSTHVYAGPRPYYIVSFSDPNRIDEIINIDGSVNILFYIEDTIKIFDPVLVGLNSSPILLAPPIDFANIFQPFYHNPAAFDPDGDSLHYRLVTPLQSQGLTVPFTSPTNIPTFNSSSLSINPSTGLISWISPQQTGIYNIAILISEFRNGQSLGSVLRDMQIIVKANSNLPPVFTLNPTDTCVIAGSLLGANFIAVDPDVTQEVEMTAYGGPLELTNSPATFISVTNGNTAQGEFMWQTVCDHIRRQFYEVVVKAEDNFVTNNQLIPLVDIFTWLIYVVGPPPENVQALAGGDSILVTWADPYTCEVTNKFIGFAVWRREGSNPFAPDTCERGLAGRGYQKIAERVTDYEYIDRDVVRGKDYCYRIVAEFAEQTVNDFLYNKVEGMPSAEACASLPRNLPVITHVSVERTGTIDGQVFVDWVKPLTGAGNLDTIQSPGPYTFRLYRAQGFGNDGAPFTQIATFTSNTFADWTDTFFVDNGINTADFPHSYYVEFLSGNSVLGETEIASSVFLTLTATDRRMDLSWEANVPWTNTNYVILRFDAASSQFLPISSTSNTTYIDGGLINDSLYCYIIKAFGEYSIPSIPFFLENFSEEECARPIDTLAPCPPVLKVSNFCEQLSEGEFCSEDPSKFKNLLTWSDPFSDCSEDVFRLNVYFTSPVDGQTYLVDSVLNLSDTILLHSFNNSLAGCYYLTAIDSIGNESTPGNTVCVDNCPCYNLPNVFTPNGDGANDFFTPIFPYRYIGKVDMKIYDRWGVLVYETENPDINWDGKDSKTGKPQEDGVYYYSCAVYEIRSEGLIERAALLKGYIHLITGNGGVN